MKFSAQCVENFLYHFISYFPLIFECKMSQICSICEKKSCFLLVFELYLKMSLKELLKWLFWETIISNGKADCVLRLKHPFVKEMFFLFPEKNKFNPSF